MIFTNRGKTFIILPFENEKGIFPFFVSYFNSICKKIREDFVTIKNSLIYYDYPNF